jgi:hypothetical protein
MKTKFYLALLATILISSLSARTYLFAEEDTTYVPELILYEEYFKTEFEGAYQSIYGKEYDPTDTTFFNNPYKIMIDKKDNNFFDILYGTHYFEVDFTKNIIPRDTIYEDNRLIYYTIDDILPQYQNCIEGFKQIEARYGKFRFVDRNTNKPDSTKLFPRRELSIIFDNYIRVYGDYLYWYFIDELNGGTVFFDKGMMLGTFWQLGNIEQKQSKYEFLPIEPNISSDEIIITLEEKDILFPHIINIIDSAGNIIRMVQTGLSTKQEVNVSNLPIGTYTVQLGNKLGKFIKK